MDKVRVLRIIEYTGNRDIIEETVRKSIHGTKRIECSNMTIRAATIGEFPEILVPESIEDEQPDKP